MLSPNQALAESLTELNALTSAKGVVGIRTSDLSRVHRERLLKNGFIKEVTKGWYIPANPDERPGDSTSWYISYWKFCAEYLKDKYGEEYCLSAEQSLLMHAGNTTIPHQLIVRSPKGSNAIIELLSGTSLYIMKSPLPDHAELMVKGELRILTLPSALVYCSPVMYEKHPIEMRTALALVDDASEVLKILLEGAHTTVAGRLAGGFRNLGLDKIADQILKSMQAAGLKAREEDLFKAAAPIKLHTRQKSPYVNRINLMWDQMRNVIIPIFPEPPGIPADQKGYLDSIDEIYRTDAYHSLSIERYTVSPELIEKVKSGDWNLQDEADRKHRDALAARGYWQAAQLIKQSIEKILSGQNPGEVVDQYHSDWYLELFSPNVAAGILKRSDLAGYRSNQVYISNSQHVPLSSDAVRDAIPALFELIKNEPHAGVRAVLGHFIFVYIHPYMDGNGRMGRFLFNVMLASGGYPWTVIPVEERDRYMASLDRASVYGDILPFAGYLAYLVSESMSGRPVAKLRGM
jgi:fido (protein-threonine AMPylation protein)